VRANKWGTAVAPGAFDCGPRDRLQESGHGECARRWNAARFVSGRGFEMAGSGEGGSSSIKRIIGVVVPAGLLMFLAMHQANFAAGRALLLAFGDLESTYQSAWPTFGGDVTAKDVVVYLPDLPEETALRFETLRVETPGLFWYLRSMFKKELPDADELSLVLDGATSPAGFDYALGSFGVFGTDSASPFEAEGCERDSLWETAELRDMGLEPGPTRVTFSWKVEGRLLTVTEEVAVPNVSTMRYRRLEQMDEGRTNIVVLDYAGDSTVMSDRWEVEDAGFVAARNKFCARRDRIDSAQFPDRHVAAVVRRLEAEGLAVGPDAVARYRDFAGKGGMISMGGQYAFEMKYNDAYTAETWLESLPNLAAFVVHDGTQSPVAWRLVDKRPLRGDDDDTTWQMMVDEGFQFGAPPAPDAVVLTAEEILSGVAGASDQSASAGARKSASGALSTTAPGGAASTGASSTGAASTSAASTDALAGVGSTGGGSTGGASTGGASTGGASTGGASTGGASTGGASTGGASTGGASTGGASTGGASTGGASTGGASTGGGSTGGGSTGGGSTGGASTGGASTGGASTGGASTGGGLTAGASSGGASAGGASARDVSTSAASTAAASAGASSSRGAAVAGASPAAAPSADAPASLATGSTSASTGASPTAPAGPGPATPGSTTTLASAASPATAVTAPKPPPPPPKPRPLQSGDEIAYANLNQHRGWFLMFNLTTGKSRYAELVRADDSSVEVRVRRSGGYASYSIKRTDLISTTIP
jgi:hypothetical protein